MTSSSSLPLLVGLALFAGCTDDFTVGPPSSDAGTVVDATGDGVVNDSPSGLVEAGASCDEIKAALTRQRDVITACTELDGLCSNLLKDECDCDVGVVASGAAVDAYVALVKDFKNRPCPVAACKACRLTGPAGFACDARDRDAGGFGFCVDPAASF